MSDMTMSHCINAPRPFPEKGRMIMERKTVWDNARRQALEEGLYAKELDSLKPGLGATACAGSCHVSLFFDGTNNNNDYDTDFAVPPHPSNIAKMYHATLEKVSLGYYSYYMPGVGTPFPNIGEMDFSTLGMASATRGEDRINWAILRLVDVLSMESSKTELDLQSARQALRSMSTVWPMTALGKENRKRTVMALLNPSKKQVQGTLPKILKLKLFVYGFSRGAAEARTFVSWLTELFETPEGAALPEQTLLGIPVSIEFLGLLDTVASVGVARATPLADGHMDWADGTQTLPDEARFPGLIKDCRHFVAAHEQRLCFPLDSIRRADGRYPSYAKEVIYPGMHSDVGGGYPAGDQGKARNSHKDLLSQVPLHDLYAAAFEAGAPLLVEEPSSDTWPDLLPAERRMESSTFDEFKVGAEVIDRFNAWRTTLGLQTETSPDPSNGVSPIPLGNPLEDIMADQLAWITAWRIDRFARGTYAHQPFYAHATQTNAATQVTQKAARKAEQAAREANRKLPAGSSIQTANSTATVAGVPAYEPVIDQQQLREAAIEFEHDYVGKRRPHTSPIGWVLDGALRETVYLINGDDEQAEYKQLKTQADIYAQQMFTPLNGKPGHYRVSDVPHLAKLVALFDDQVHDSRAWFLHDATGSREMWSDYFRYRMIYFGDHSNKRLTPVVIAGRVVGIATVLGGAYAIRMHGYKGAAGVFGALNVGYQVINRATGEPEPFLPNAAEMLKPTLAIGSTVAQFRADQQKTEEALRMAAMTDYLKRSGGWVEKVAEVVA